jgi:hypothetical protein
VSADEVRMGPREYRRLGAAIEAIQEAHDKLSRPFVCMDCSWHNAHPIPEPTPEDYVCPHWTPEYWEAQGYQRNWGDAAVMHWPELEILRKEENGETRFVILAPRVLRRPVELYAEGFGWGCY